MFYNSFAISIITYGLPIYGNCGKLAKTNLKKIDSVQRRITRAIFLKKCDSMKEIQSKNKINSLYELFITEVVHEVFRELSLESPLKLLNFEEQLKFQREARWNSKGLFPSNNPRTMMKKESLVNSLMIAYSWLKMLNLILSEIKTMTLRRFKQHPNQMNCLYIVDNKDLSCLYYQKFIFRKIL